MNVPPKRSGECTRAMEYTHSTFSFVANLSPVPYELEDSPHLYPR
jgi:hypothetical protein